LFYGLVGFAGHVGDGGAAFGVGVVVGAAVPHHAGRRADGDGVVGDVAASHGVRAEHAAATDARAAKHARLHAEPAVRADPHRRLHDALVLDRQRDVGDHVVEVADVHPVGDERRGADLDVQVAVDGVVLAEHDLVTDAQRALVAADGVAVADVHPAAHLQPAVAGAAVQLHVLAEEHHAAQHNVRVGQPELEQPPVAHQVPGRVGPVPQHPAQRRHRQEPRLLGVAPAGAAP
jgi:hypothetical protein